jgi:hypothetical protein
MCELRRFMKKARRAKGIGDFIEMRRMLKLNPKQPQPDKSDDKDGKSGIGPQKRRPPPEVCNALFHIVIS